MSWQSFVDEHLVGTGTVTSAAIVGLDGNIWAASAGFTVKKDEADKIVAAFKDPSGVQAGGFYANGQKYMFLSKTDNALYGKKASTGICAQKTNGCVIIAFYDDKIQGGQCNVTVGKLADYFREVGY
mmetsp:Transcript_31013/g.50170  ORF Transcript_31013/g.50170 Transcript_31013/m.50170 type:complete len:127 (+) Transcript_31013:168-548(+)|eukprot:CAMPEP_0184649092 /NCGR_PEP_ID=MMETSP0308-20130426/6344_1 /TAXON_ID=38269 /ORGANISM="Gloeochaete witrockiana, Strain SAG 46.84" /LENGTH=126 /DNA_ID=CAMNT_0027081493 /DNA_START=158 /DNA_END=538 /DNA_ORIENTATION=-